MFTQTESIPKNMTYMEVFFIYPLVLFIEVLHI